MAAITNIQLSPLNVEDKQIWHFTKNEIYVVKSAYRLAIDLFSTDVESVPWRWHKLWRFSIPPKIKFFMWRVDRDYFPTRFNL